MKGIDVLGKPCCPVTFMFKTFVSKICKSEHYFQESFDQEKNRDIEVTFCLQVALEMVQTNQKKVTNRALNEV